MEEGEQKVCLAEPKLEKVEETPLQVQLQLLEEMQDGEALAAEVVLEAKVETVGSFPLFLVQALMEVSVEVEVMGAVVEEGEEEGGQLLTLRSQG